MKTEMILIMTQNGCLSTPEVTCTEIQQETINAILWKGDRGAENRSHSDVSRPS